MSNVFVPNPGFFRLLSARLKRWATGEATAVLPYQILRLEDSQTYIVFVERGMVEVDDVIRAFPEGTRIVRYSQR